MVEHHPTHLVWRAAFRLRRTLLPARLCPGTTFALRHRATADDERWQLASRAELRDSELRHALRRSALTGGECRSDCRDQAAGAADRTRSPGVDSSWCQLPAYAARGRRVHPVPGG